MRDTTIGAMKRMRMKNLVIRDFINSHLDCWEELLAANPYNLFIRREGDYVLLKYSALSDFQHQLCKEARGIILQPDENGEYICVARGFDKFFNSSEVWADTPYINWEHCEVREKIDGTNIRFWYDKNEWHISTLGCISAANAPFTNGLTFEDLVIQACGGYIHHLLDMLDRNYCYIFELTGPNRIVINYGQQPILWYLGRRNMKTMEEDTSLDISLPPYILRPQVFHDLTSLDACLHNAKFMSEQEEGYVVSSRGENGYYRIKIKGSEYIREHKIRGNGVLTIKRVIELWQSDTLDDYLGIYPEHQGFVNQVFGGIKQLASRLNHTYSRVSKMISRKDIAIVLADTEGWIRAYAFMQLDGKIENASSYLQSLRPRKLADLVDEYVNVKEIGVMEDE